MSGSQEFDDLMTAAVSLLIGGVCVTFAFRVDDVGEAMILAVVAIIAAANAIRVILRSPR